MEPWVYELDLRYTILPTMKVVYSDYIKYLVKIDNQLLTYSMAKYDNGVITHTLSPVSYMPETYRVPLEDDDCPDLAVIVALYECMVRCGLTTVSVSKKITDEEKAKIGGMKSDVRDAVLESAAIPKITTADVPNIKKYGENYSEKIREEAFEEFSFSGLDDLGDIWTDKPSWEREKGCD